MNKKVSLLSVVIAVFLSVSGTAFAFSHGDIVAKFEQIFDTQAKSDADKKLAELNPSIEKAKSEIIAEVQAEVDRNKVDATKQINDYINAKMAAYSSRFQQIKNEEKQQVQTSKQQAVDNQKAQIDRQFSQFESDVYQALNGSLK